MKRLTAIVAAVLLLSKLEVTKCDINTTTNTTSGGYPYGGLSPSEIALLSSKVSAAVPPSSQSPTALALIDAISTSPYLLPSLPPSLVFYFLNELISSPINLHSIEPSAVASLIDSLCTSSSLFKVAPTSALVDFVTAIAVSPKILTALPPSTIVRLLNKIHGETPGGLHSLSPAVRAALIHSSLLSPKVLGTLKPTEILFLIDVFLDAECVLAELPFSGILALLKTISSSPALLANVPTHLIVDLLYRISELAPALFCAVPLDVTNALLAPIIASVHSQSPTTLVRLTAVVTSSPYMFTILDPTILSSMLIALSEPETLRTVPPAVLVKLLTDLSKRITKNIKPETIVGILHSIVSVSPGLLCDLPCSVRSVYATGLTSPEVIVTLSHRSSVKLIDILCNTPCFLAELPPDFINQIVIFMISDEELLRAIPPENIVGFVFNITAQSPSILRETRPDDIRKLFSPLITAPALSWLRPGYFGKLLSSLASSPFLTRALPTAQIVNILTTLNSSSETIPSTVYINILTQIFTEVELLSKIPFGLLLNLLMKIETDYGPQVVCTIPPAAISAFLDYPLIDPAALTSLTPTDTGVLVHLLAKCPYFLTQLSTEALNVLLESIAASSTVSNALPIEKFVKLVGSVCALSPSIFCSLSPKAIRAITDSFDSADTLSGLSSETISELTTAISRCPCLLSALDRRTVADLLDALSVSPSALCLLKPGAVVNLITLISYSDALTATSVPTYPLIRFLRTLSAVAPSTLCSIPMSVYTVLLNPLKSWDAVNGLTPTGVENLIDVLIAAPCLLAGLPRPILVNTIVAITDTFTVLPYAKIITLLTALHSVSPSLICIVPDNVLTDLLAVFGSRSELSALPSEFLVALITLVSSSPCVLDLMPAPALESLLTVLSSSPKLLKDTPANVLDDFLIKLSLTPASLTAVPLPLIVRLLSALYSASGPSACALQPIVVHALLAPLCDDKTIFELGPTDVASLLGIATSTPCVLAAIIGTTLDTLISKVASSSHLVTDIPPSLLASFLGTVTSSPAALNAVRPATVVHLLTTVAMRQPSVLSSLPPRVATALLGVFQSPEVFASLPPPVINNFINLLTAFPNVLAALPLSTLNALLRFLSSSPTAIGSLPSCTLVRFLAALSSLPPLLRVLPPGLLVSFISAISTASPKFLCLLPPTIVIALITSVTCGPALASSAPASIASLISTFNRSSCLINIVPLPVLVSFLTYLSNNQNSLCETSKYDLITFVNNIQSPGSIPRVSLGVPVCPPSDYFEDFSSFRTHSPAIGADKTNTSRIFFNYVTTITPIPEPIPQNDPEHETDPTPSKNNELIKFNQSTTENPKNILFDLIPKFILPKNANGSTVFVIPKV